MNLLRFLTPKSQVAYLQDTASVRNGLEKLRHHGYTAIPVIARDGRYVGTVTEGDFLWALLEQGDCAMKSLEKRRVADLLRKNWNPPVRVGEMMEQLLNRLMDQNFVPVVDDRDVFVGIVTRRSVLGSALLPLLTREFANNLQNVKNSEIV